MPPVRPLRAPSIELVTTRYRTDTARALRLAALAVDSGWNAEISRSHTLVLTCPAGDCRSRITIGVVGRTLGTVESSGECAIGFTESARYAGERASEEVRDDS